MPLFTGDTFDEQLDDLDRRAQPGPVPDRRPARPDRPAPGDPQRLRPLHGPRDRAGRVEPRDPRLPDLRPGVVRGRRRALRLRDRRPRRHARPAPHARAGPAAGRTSSSSRRSSRATRASSGSSILMLPVTIGLGLINFNLLINSTLGSLVSENAPRAIDAAFRIYMLPQGLFSVAVATVLFPTLSRLAARGDRDGLRALTATGMRQIFLLLIPAAACTLVLAEPITRLIYEHGDFGPEDTDRVAEALFWFSFSLPFAGVNLLLTRTFFSLQRPWIPTALAGGEPARERRREHRAVRAARDRRHRHRDGRRQPHDDAEPVLLPARRAARPARGGRDDTGRREDESPPPRCWPASPTAGGGRSTRSSATPSSRRRSRSPPRSPPACRVRRRRCSSRACRRRSTSGGIAPESLLL